MGFYFVLLRGLGWFPLLKDFAKSLGNPENLKKTPDIFGLFGYCFLPVFFFFIGLLNNHLRSRPILGIFGWLPG